MVDLHLFFSAWHTENEGLVKMINKYWLKSCRTDWKQIRLHFQTKIKTYRYRARVHWREISHLTNLCQSVCLSVELLWWQFVSIDTHTSSPIESNHAHRKCIDSIIVHVCHPSTTTQETLGHATHFFVSRRRQRWWWWSVFHGDKKRIYSWARTIQSSN